MTGSSRIRLPVAWKIALVMAGATPLTPNFNTGINAQLGDGVFQNDKPLPATFPYIASPHAGNK